MLHRKACSLIYPSSEQKRFVVPDEKIPWNIHFPEYNPPNFTAEVVKKKPVWADPDIQTKSFLFNRVDGLVNRKSFTGEYMIKENFPLNPIGRTGLSGRGILGKWGPNHAADPIVTRWSRDVEGKIIIDKESGKPVLQFVAIRRRDTGEWAIPGGMVDANEQVSQTLKREFGEEALNSLDWSEDKRKSIEEAIAKLFSKGKVIYSGYVDDPRNTDNAWMETVAVNFHDEGGTSVGRLSLEAGDDAAAVRWMNVSSKLNLYANHITFLEQVAKLRNAFW